MEAQLLLDDLASRGIHVEPQGDGLVVEPASTLTETDRVLLRQLKPKLLELLQPSPEVPAVDSQNCPAFRDAAAGEFTAEVPDVEPARNLAAAWRGAARELGDLAGHPALPYKPGHSVGPGAATWGRFIAQASVPQLRLVVAALRNYLAVMPNPNDVDSPDLPGGDQCPM